MTGYFWFYLLSAIILFIVIIYMIRLIIKWRTKYNLTMLIICILFFIIDILSFFFPHILFPAHNITIQIMFWAVVMLAFIIFLFYPETKRFLEQRKNKNK
jgi:hypothetical protein